MITQSQSRGRIISIPLLLSFSKNTPTTQIYTLSLHDALPIYLGRQRLEKLLARACPARLALHHHARDRSDVCRQDRKSTRLNSSHPSISYAVFCLKKKKV